MAIRIPFEPIESSNLSQLGYDAAKQILAVQFKNGDIWHYAGVAPDLALEFYAALSKGQFYGLHIRGKFAASKMTGECPDCGARGWIGDTCEDCGCSPYAAEPQHALVHDHPSATSKRARKAQCGADAAPSAFARSVDEVTCAGCRQALDHLENLQL